MSEKLVIPTALFSVLSPGILLGTQGNLRDTVIHACVLVVLWRITALEGKLELSQNDMIIPASLFVLLSPGILLTLPAGVRGVMNYNAVLVHTLVFLMVYAFIRFNFPTLF
jgi:hypothetical protein